MASLGVGAFEYKVEGPEAVRRAAAAGAEHCELVLPADVTEAGVPAVRAAAREAGVEVSAVATLTKLNTAEDVGAELERIDASVRAAAALGSPFAITYFGGHPTRGAEEAVDRYARAIRPSLVRAADLGVTVLIENHFSHAPGEVTNSAEGCVALVEAVDSPAFAVNFDPCNFAISGVDVVAAYELLKPMIRNLHVKDARPYDAERDAAYPGRVAVDLRNGPHIFVAVEHGVTDNRGVLDRVRRDGLDVPITVEAHVPADQLDSVLRQGLDLCREYMSPGDGESS